MARCTCTARTKQYAAAVLEVLPSLQRPSPRGVLLRLFSRLAMVATMGSLIFSESLDPGSWVSLPRPVGRCDKSIDKSHVNVSMCLIHILDPFLLNGAASQEEEEEERRKHLLSRRISALLPVVREARARRSRRAVFIHANVVNVYDIYM